MNVSFTPNGLADLHYWIKPSFKINLDIRNGIRGHKGLTRKALVNPLTASKHDRKTADRILTLIEEIKRNPFSGIGKPEPLKHQLSGSWSRRINLEDRLVYQANSEEIIILSCRYHY